mmetsp:Transcript_36448/g.116823  ORF Transcript_36448/g.116823 Transcript_36448/m.116823 type:complete len:212 (-) Transcript_36448:609-1244(-)
MAAGSGGCVVGRGFCPGPARRREARGAAVFRRRLQLVRWLRERRGRLRSVGPREVRRDPAARRVDGVLRRGALRRGRRRSDVHLGPGPGRHRLRPVGSRAQDDRPPRPADEVPRGLLRPPEATARLGLQARRHVSIQDLRTDRDLPTADAALPAALYRLRRAPRRRHALGDARRPLRKRRHLTIRPILLKTYSLAPWGLGGKNKSFFFLFF